MTSSPPPPSCSHGKTFDERCIDCEIINFRSGLAAAQKRVASYGEKIEALMREKAALNGEVAAGGKDG